MRKSVLIVVGTSVLVLSGCGVKVSQPSQSTAREAVNNLVYAQDLRTDQCYAVVSSASAGHLSDQSMTITWVPCDPKVLEQIKN